jgi:hypothetical protein
MSGTVADYRVDRLLGEWVLATQHDDVTLSEAMHSEGLTIPSLQFDDALTKQPAICLRH